jgi:peptide/nickel transport system permease protein
LRTVKVKTGNFLILVLVIVLVLPLFYTVFAGGKLSAQFTPEKILLLVLAVISTGVIPVFKKKVGFLNRLLNGTFLILGSIIMIAIFAPLIAPFGASEIISAGECRLLSPFSQKIFLFSKSGTITDAGYEKLAVDDYKIGEKAVLLRHGRQVEVEKELILHEGGKPKIQKVFFLLGTDEFGRDLFSRVIFGARVSLMVGISAAFISFIIAAFFAFMSALPYKILDMLLNRVSEIFLAIPSLFIIIFAISFFGNNYFSVVIVMAVTSWMSLYKILNGEIKRIMNKNFIVSSIMLGVPKNRIFINEIIPLILPSIVVNIIFQIANFIIVEASLSFLGLGPGNDYASWGGIIESGISYLSSAWWLIFFPGVFLFFTIVTLNKSGNQLEKYFNPVLK